MNIYCLWECDSVLCLSCKCLLKKIYTDADDKLHLCWLIKRLLTAEQMGGAYILLPLGRCPARRSKCNLCLIGGARISNHTHTLTLATPLSLYPIRCPERWSLKSFDSAVSTTWANLLLKLAIVKSDFAVVFTSFIQIFQFSIWHQFCNCMMWWHQGVSRNRTLLTSLSSQ